MIKLFKALIRAAKCKDEIAFVRIEDRCITRMVEYKSDKLWTNSELIKMLRQGYVMREPFGGVPVSYEELVNGVEDNDD